jgi:putative Mn2+ efflux pump MntP
LLGVALIYAITANLDKIALNASSAPFFLVVDVGLTALGAFTLYAVTKTKARNHHKERAAIQKNASHLPAITYGLVLGLSVIIHMTALGMTDQIPYVLAGKRAGTVLFATLGGLLLGMISTHYRAELHDYKRKVASAIIVIVGTLLIVLLG